MSNDKEVVIDPALLAKLGRRHPAIPPEHLPHDGGIGMVRNANPPKQYVVEIKLKPPGS